MDTLFAVCLLVINFIRFSHGAIDITALNVPKSVSLTDNKDIILDCVYDVTDNQGLVIKWFLDKDEQVYQWIPANRRPQAMGRLRDRLDLDYKATNDPYTMYRALKIKEVTKDLTGIYSCKVSSFENEDVESKKMVVYQPATDIEFIHDEDEDTLICNAEGVYPKPKMNIYIKDQDDDDNDDEDDNNSNNKKDDNDDDNDADDINKKKKRTTKRADKDGDGKDDGNSDADTKKDDDDDDGNASTKKKSGDNDSNGDDDDDDDNNKDANSNEDEDTIELEDDGTYNISSVLKYEEVNLKEPIVFVCELYIPDTDYKVFERISYVPEDYQTTTSKTDIQLEFSVATNDDSSKEANGAMTTMSPVSTLVTFFSVAFTLKNMFF